MPGKIVVVEDEPAIADAVAARLRADGHQVLVASDGLEGVALCRQERPDLVVLDLMLPGLDGYEVCRQVQAERPVPVLVLCGLALVVDVSALARLGLYIEAYLARSRAAGVLDRRPIGACPAATG